jgi:hypothetical protein
VLTAEVTRQRIDTIGKLFGILFVSGNHQRHARFVNRGWNRLRRSRCLKWSGGPDLPALKAS